MAAPGAEGRRSPRVALRVPIRIACEGASCNAHTAIVNRHGAMVLAPQQYPEEATIEVWNVESGESARFHQVWYGGEDLPGLHKLGIEMLEERPEFWGPEYEAALEAGA